MSDDVDTLYLDCAATGLPRGGRAIEAAQAVMQLGNPHRGLASAASVAVDVVEDARQKVLGLWTDAPKGAVCAFGASTTWAHSGDATCVANETLDDRVASMYRGDLLPVIVQKVERILSRTVRV